MLNVLLKKYKAVRARSRLPKALMLPVLLLIGIGQAQAQTEVCFRIRDLTASGSWNMAPNGTEFKNGVVVGRLTAYAQFYMPLAHGELVYVDAYGAAQANAPYGAYPLVGMPGLGLVVRWFGYSATTTLTHTVAPAPAGAIISNKPSWHVLMRARSSANYSLTQNYSLELVVIDEKIYKGGRLNSGDAGQVSTLTASKKGAALPQACLNNHLDFAGALTGILQVPELPKPALPSCRFSTSTLRQSVTLGPVDPGQIPSSSTLRPSGEAGQNHFLIEGTGCSKDTKLSFYFTDTRDMATTKSYLLTSNSAVGIRLFHRGEYEPLPFGPAPSGSWVPPHYAPSVGPATADGATLSTGFTAQYVRLPNKTEADIRPGPLEAAATFVIVYP
ncbi:fimbrial protein [Alcaligenes faecalis]|uniref:fimbrial protein n=1 Tax=Alcaligenes faecalis TaxID=511 RepID=UPI000A53A2AF|nr:fimbrial protein [Alcaligenes faecalis]